MEKVSGKGSIVGRLAAPSSSGTIISRVSKQNEGLINGTGHLNEESLCFALGLYRNKAHVPEYVSETGDTTEEERLKKQHPDAAKCDLSVLRGIGNDHNKLMLSRAMSEDTADLKALAEIVPGLRNPATGKFPVNEPTNAILTAEGDHPSDLIHQSHVCADLQPAGALQALRSPGMTQSVTSAVIPKNSINDYISSSSSEKGSAFTDPALMSRSFTKPKKHHSRNHRNHPSSSSVATISTHEIRLPMYLPTFKPATGCTNASDFIVRCFAARLRAGITVVKHGRSRWCKSRLRILHVHSDGRSLTWKPAPGEPSSKSKPPKLDLSTCMEVRHAWSPDPLYPMFTGTQILRQKCEAANAHKSFALVFPKRTVDITSLTADQCKVLMEGFSALCFRLQVANLAHSKNKLTSTARNNTLQKDDNFDDARSTTDTNTLTNNSNGSRVSRNRLEGRVGHRNSKNLYV